MSFRFSKACPLALVSALTALFGAPQLAHAATSRLAFDFNAALTWNDARPYASSSALGAKAQWQAVGSYDVEGSANQSGGWRLSADASAAPKKWMAGLRSGLLHFSSTETNLGKLTLAFTLSANVARPVKVKIASLDANGKRSGGLETLIYPAAPDFLQRYALDLNTFKASGAGKFDVGAPQIQLAFEIDEANWPRGKNEIRVDDVNLSGPAFYVSPNGSNGNDGKTEKTAFATPQKALDMAQAGDIILLMEGTYDAGNDTVARFNRAGTPAAWIVLKNYPGQKPTLTCTGWNTIFIGGGSKEKRDETTNLAYLEVRGLHVRGQGDVAKTKYPEAMNKADSRTNTNGISTSGRYLKNPIHHIRFADNIVEYCTGGGIGVGETDWAFVENNISRYNCWTTIYATSGISTLGATNFDASDNIYKILIRGNVCYRNQTYEIWKEISKPSDGNGIIIDVNQQTNARPNGSFRGRTLVQNNLSYDNGGSGIHTVRANRVDIINNTTYLNSANKELQYSQIFAYGSEDVRIFNNILVAPVADIAAGEKPEPVNKISGPSKDVVYSHNLYFGGNIPPVMGEGDQIADANFVRPAVDPQTANFRLNAGSPAIGAGLVLPFTPYLNHDGVPRGAKPNIGAY